MNTVSVRKYIFLFACLSTLEKENTASAINTKLGRHAYCCVAVSLHALFMRCILLKLSCCHADEVKSA